jgi:MarR-like DNA-binding transcriptional regulator SgrR of sgrS sRNA
MPTFSLDSVGIAHKGKRRLLLTISEAAEALGVSERHVKRLIHEADANRKSRWRWGKELINLSPVNAQRRMVRINVGAVVPGL